MRAFSRPFQSVLTALVLILGMAGCGDKMDPAAGEAQACQTAGPITYVAHIEPILQFHCTTCHSVNATDRRSAPALVNFDVYQESVDQIDRLILRTASRTMPPISHDTALSDEDICVIQAWLADGLRES